jgi:hypothetical protein
MFNNLLYSPITTPVFRHEYHKLSLCAMLSLEYQGGAGNVIFNPYRVFHVNGEVSQFIDVDESKFPSALWAYRSTGFA